MKRVVWIIVMVLGIFLTAKGAEDLAPGIYWLSPEGPQMVKGECAEQKEYQVWHFKDTTAEIQTGSTPEFLFVYEAKLKSVLVNGNVFKCKFTSNPHYVMLAKLKQKEKERELNVIPDTLHSLVSFQVDSLTPRQYKLRVSEPIRSGEYVLIFYIPGFWGLKYVVMERMWPFSVYAPELDVEPEPEVKPEPKPEPKEEPKAEPGHKPILRATR